jgi:hypothetical protein
MSAVALLLGAATSVGAATSAGQEVGGGDSVWASSSSSARWPSGREITDGAPNKRADETPKSAAETHRWAVYCPRGDGVR